MKKTILCCFIFFCSLSASAELEISQIDFKTLFNSYRFSQATVLPWPSIYWPFDGAGGGPGINHIPPGNDKSPAQKYDEFFATGGKAAEWENKNHNCELFESSLQMNCRSWYGHCNGWTAAALFNSEPDYDHPIVVTNPNTGVTMSFNYMDIKALLTEAWLDVWATYSGTGSTVPAAGWIFDPNDPIAKAPSSANPGVSNFDAYWDVTPRAFFFALTNYLGIKKVGIAVDRFTGSQVWNQPLVAYRLLPIQGNKATPITKDGQSIYPVTFGVKIYWANDSVGYDFKRRESLTWDVSNPTNSNDTVPNPPGREWAQDSTPDGAYVSRYLSFTLFFDAPVVASDDGITILSAGKIVGDGVWAHADKSQTDVWYPYGPELSQTHPDFMWRPDSITRPQYRNPIIDPEKIYKFILKQSPEPLGIKF